MSKYLGDFAVDSTVRVYFSTNAGDGGRESPSDTFEVADFRIYKNAFATARASQAGWTYDNEVEAMTGVHCLSIDLSDNTDAGFYVAGSEYAVILYPDETIDGQTVSAVLAQFSIERTNGAMARVKLGVPAVAPGAAGGMFIAGSNAATTLASLVVSGTTTLTGAVSLGSTLGVTGAVSFASTFAVGGLTTLDSLTVTNATTLTGEVALGASLTLTGGIAVGANVNVTGTLNVTGAVTLTDLSLSGDLAIGGTTTFTGNVSLGGTLAVTGTTTFTGAVTCSAGIVADITGDLSGAVGSLSGHTVQTGDSFARLGAPAGASVSADIAAMKVDTAAILVDTGSAGVVVAAASKAGYSLAATGADLIAKTSTFALALSDAVLDEAMSGHTTAGTLGKAIADILDDTGTNGVVVAAASKTGYSLAATGADLIAKTSTFALAVSDAVWDELLSGHAGAGSSGAALSAAGTAGDPWITVLPGDYTAGMAGYILGTNLDAAISGIGSLAGAGAITDTVTIYEDDEVTVIDGAEVWVTNDADGVDGGSVVAGTLVTNSNGEVTFNLDVGDCWVHVQKGGWNFTTTYPRKMTVSDGGFAWA